jgi:HEAT repeats
MTVVGVGRKQPGANDGQQQAPMRIMFDFLKRGVGLDQTMTPTPASPAPPLPDDVVSLLRRRDELNDAELGIHLLDEQRALARLDTSSIWGRLGLVTLDDAEDSNPYVLITGGVCRGMVAHFFHDPDPQVEFASLQDFEGHLRDLRRRRMPLDEEDRLPAAHPEQAALAGALLELACADDDAHASWLICFYAPLLRDDHREVLAVLATHDDFFVREAAAEALGRVDVREATDLLKRLAADGHPQVAAAARRAIAARTPVDAR